MREHSDISNKATGITAIAASSFRGLADRMSAPIRRKFDEIYKQREAEIFGSFTSDDAPKGP